MRPLEIADADVEADYEDSSGSKEFRVIAEVSAKRNVGPQFFSKQFKQAWQHANAMAEDDIGGRVYALVISGGSLIHAPDLGDAFHGFVKEVDMKPDGPVRVIPVNGRVSQRRYGGSWRSCPPTLSVSLHRCWNPFSGHFWTPSYCRERNYEQIRNCSAIFGWMR